MHIVSTLTGEPEVPAVARWASLAGMDKPCKNVFWGSTWKYQTGRNSYILTIILQYFCQDLTTWLSLTRSDQTSRPKLYALAFFIIGVGISVFVMSVVVVVETENEINALNVVWNVEKSLYIVLRCWCSCVLTICWYYLSVILQLDFLTLIKYLKIHSFCWMLSAMLIYCMIYYQLISGLREDSGVLLLILDNVIYCIRNGNSTHQSVLHGLSDRLFPHPVVWSRFAVETSQVSLETVSYYLRWYY